MGTGCHSRDGPLLPGPPHAQQTLTEAPAAAALAAVLGPCCCQQSLSDAPTLSSACEITMILCKIIIITMQERGFPEHEACSKHTQQPQVSRVGFPGSLPPVLLPASRYNTPACAPARVSQPVTDSSRGRAAPSGGAQTPKAQHRSLQLLCLPISSSPGSAQAGNSSCPSEG